MKPALRAGIPDFNIPALEPFTVPRLKVNRTAPNLRIKATIKQAIAYGASNFKVEKLRINLNNKYVAEIKLFFPELYVTTDYDIRGSRILALDLSGKGKLRGNFTRSSICHYSDPNVALCIQRVAEQARHLLAQGVPSLNIQPLEPLKIPSIRLRQHNMPKKGFKYDAWLSDVMLKGITNYTFNNLDDPNVALCIQRVAEQARHLLAQGVPSLNIQPLEPLKIPSIRLRQHNMPKKGFKYDAWLSDVMLKGITNYTFNNLDVYPEELKVTANISLPQLHMHGMCTAGLEALGARVHKRMLIRDATVKLRCTGAVKADLMEAHSTTGEMEMITDHIVSMHSSDIAKEVQPAVETALAMVLEDIANKFLKHIPSEMVFAN
ncbi:Uncharacterized protein OBRU01_20202, partial [Operophtera brumata]